MLDIDGFLTSNQFVTQLAAFIVTILSTFLRGILTGFLGGTGETGL
jgi:hypothetical protein